MCKRAMLVMAAAVPLMMTGCGATSGRYIRPMLKAASQGDTAELGDLVRRGGDVNALSKRGWAPLHMAAGSGAPSAVEWLVGKGALVDLPNGQGQTALCIAAGLGHTSVVRYLVGTNADVNLGFPLYLASKHGNIETVQALIDAGCDPNRRSSVSGLTPAHAAAALGHADVLAALLRAGADPSIRGWVEGIEVTPADVAFSHPVHRDVLLEALRNPESQEFMAEVSGKPGPGLAQSPAAAGSGTSQVEGSKAVREPFSDSEDALVRIDVERARLLAVRAIAKNRPDIDLADYEPSYTICLTHPDAHPFVSVVVEWLGRTPLEVQKGKNEQTDRIRVGKLSVKLSGTGQTVDIRLSDTWLYRNM